MEGRLNGYLSFIGAFGVLMILVTIIGVTRSALPFIYENLVLYPLIKILIFGSITYAIVKTKNLNTNYLFPKKKFGESVWPFLAIIISFFLFERVVADTIDLVSVGSDEFVKSKNDGIYTFKERGIKHFLSLVIVGPIMEEIMFRGLIFMSFLKHYSQKKSIVLSSFLFAVLHISPDRYFFLTFTFSFLLAAFLCWIVLKTENLKIAIGCHMFWNFMNYFFLSLIFTMLQIKVHNVTELILVFSIMIVIALVLLFFGFRWIRKYYSTLI